MLCIYTHTDISDHNESKEIKEILRLDLLNLVTGILKKCKNIAEVRQKTNGKVAY